MVALASPRVRPTGRACGIASEIDVLGRQSPNIERPPTGLAKPQPKTDAKTCFTDDDKHPKCADYVCKQYDWCGEKLCSDDTACKNNPATERGFECACKDGFKGDPYVVGSAGSRAALAVHAARLPPVPSTQKHAARRRARPASGCC